MNINTKVNTYESSSHFSLVLKIQNQRMSCKLTDILVIKD